jgi:cytochrome c oxidase subunit 2
VTAHDMLAAAGPASSRIASLWWLFFWVCAAVYVLVVAFLIMATIRGRRRPEPMCDQPTARTLKTAVGTATAVSIAALFALIVASIAAGSAVGNFAGRDSRQLEIEITGHQWWWEVKYPNALNPSAEITDANQIHIPIHTPVLLRLDTRDVIHSFWIPNLHGKLDLIPGRVNKLRLQADRAGVYGGQCAEFCGLQHAHMALTVVAERPEDFARWQSRMSQGAPTPVTPQQQRGQQLFLSAPCGKCHNILGLDAYGTIGPDLTHFRSRPTLAAGTLPNTRGNLAGWISNAPAIKPGTAMPPVQMSGEELQDLLAYLETLR